MKISNISFSLSEQPDTLEEWKQKLKEEIEVNLNNGSSVILYPELFLMGLSHYMPEEEISAFVENKLIPGIQKQLKTNQLVVLGSYLRYENDAIYNAAPIIQSHRVKFQCKMYLTPWENDLTPGMDLLCFDFKGLKSCVVICFDIEQPDLAVKLKNESIDLIMVPSATTNRNGNDRVNRCASARAIELGAVVVTSPIVGDSSCDLVDHNEGRQGFFLPAQDTMIGEQEIFSLYSTSNHIVKVYEFNEELIRELKKTSNETKPFLKPVDQRKRVMRI